MTTETLTPARARYQRDQDLAVALASLAPDAWRQLFEQHYDAIYHYAQLRTASDVAAGEIADAVFTHVVVIARKFPSSRNGSISRLLELTDRIMGRGKMRSPASRRNGVSHDALRESISHLRTVDRNLVLLRLIEGCSAAETGRLLRTSPAKIRSQQMRALQQLSREHGGFAQERTAGLDATLDGCIDRLIRGDPLEDVLSAQHGRTLELLPMLRVTYAVVRLPRDPASEETRSHALASLMREVEVARFQHARQVRAREERQPRPAPVAHHPPRIHVPSVRRHVRFRRPAPRWGALVVPAAFVLAAAGVAAGAVFVAGRSSLDASNLPSNVLDRGAPVMQRGDTIWIVRGSQIQRIQTSPDTIVFRGDNRASLDGLTRASQLEVIGTERLDGTVRAAIVRIRDDQSSANVSGQ